MQLRVKDFGVIRFELPNKAGASTLVRNHTLVKLKKTATTNQQDAFKRNSIKVLVKEPIFETAKLKQAFEISQITKYKIGRLKLRLLKVIYDHRCDFFNKLCGPTLEGRFRFEATIGKRKRQFELTSNSSPAAKIGKYKIRLLNIERPMWGPQVTNPEPRVYTLKMKVTKK